MSKQRNLRLLTGLLLLIAFMAGYSDQAAAGEEAASRLQPVLRCRIEQGGSVLNLEALPVQNPYRVPMHDINGRFRFKMVVMGSSDAVEYVKIYAYDNPARQPVLVQYARYLKPEISTSSDPASLTGIQTVYSPRLEREMQYQCALTGRKS